MHPGWIAPAALLVHVDRTHVRCTVLSMVGLGTSLPTLVDIATASGRDVVLDLGHAGPPTEDGLRVLADLTRKRGSRVHLRRPCATVRAFLRLEAARGRSAAPA